MTQRDLNGTFRRVLFRIYVANVSKCVPIAFHIQTMCAHLLEVRFLNIELCFNVVADLGNMFQFSKLWETSECIWIVFETQSLSLECIRK